MLSQTSIGSGKNRKGCVRDFFATLLPVRERTGSRPTAGETTAGAVPGPREAPPS